jgi:hypothetical protein
MSQLTELSQLLVVRIPVDADPVLSRQHQRGEPSRQERLAFSALDEATQLTLANAQPLLKPGAKSVKLRHTYSSA